MGERTGLHDKLQPWKNKLIFCPSQFPSNSKRLKRSKWDLSVAARPRQNLHFLGASRLAVRLQAAVNRALLNITWTLWMEGWPGNKGLVPCGAVGEEEIQELFLWGSYRSASCFTFACLPALASCRSSTHSERGQWSLTTGYGYLSHEKSTGFQLTASHIVGT